MKKTSKDVLEIIFYVNYIGLIIFCILNFLDILGVDFYNTILLLVSFSINIFALFVNINITKIFKIKKVHEKIGYNIFFYLIFIIISIFIPFFCIKDYLYNIIKFKMYNILLILELLVSLRNLIKNKEIKKSLISIIIFNIGTIVRYLN